jgi:hypothetical protein
MAPPLGPSASHRKTPTPVSESPASSQRPFDFADLGRPMAPANKSVRTLPPVPPADASGQLEELSGDDILESDDIDALDAAAAGYSSFETGAAEAYVAPQPAPARAVPAPEPSGFEVGDVGAFDEVEVEGIALRATQPAAPPASIGVAAVVAPPVKIVETMASAQVPAQVKGPVPTTLMGMPAAPVTSPLPLEAEAEQDEQDEQEESVIVSEPAPVTARTPVVAQPIAERTLEIRGNDMAKVAAAAAKLDGEPGQTEVLVRSAMPAALQARPVQPGHGRPISVAPVALDRSRHAPVIPPMARVPSVHVPSRSAPRPATGLSGLAIGGMAAAAILLVSLVGIGGYAASRTLSAKTDAVEAPSDNGASSETTTTAAAGSPAPSPAAGDPPGAASSPLDVSSLPSAPVPGAAPRGFTGKGSFAVTPPPLPVAVPASPVAAAPAAPAAAPAPVAAAPAAPVSRSSGGALAAPGGRSAPAGAPLPPPASAPVAAAAPAAAAPAATTGVVRVDPNLRAVVVDGSFRHANDGAVVVACGSHRIKVGMKEAQTVNVPCGGAVSL